MSEVIHLLPDNIANQIAAGEVIQRPASVVKELMENSVDSGATRIELHIKDAGKTAIQVIDNGQGMSDIDAQMAFERHATSKLQTAADLFDLHTKGFRGEALASIAAIAHVTLETIEEGKEVGSKIEIKGSKITLQEPCSRAKGTSFTVKNLFFNVPARRNFLKSDHIETKHIVQEFNRIALTHPEIAFIFTHNSNVIQQLEIAGLRKRIVNLFGHNYNTKLVPIEESTDILSIKGFIVKPEFSRKTRGEQYFFVNQRFFKDNYLNHAVVSGYDNLIPSKHFPSYFIYLMVPPKTLDVNIHPTKTEVKFEDHKSLYSILRSTIKLALGKYNISPSLDFEHESQFDLSKEDLSKPIKIPSVQVNPNYNPFDSTKKHKKAPLSDKKHTHSSAIRPNKEEWKDFYKITEVADFSQQIQHHAYEDTIPVSEQYTHKFQLHNNFLLVQVKAGIMLIHINRAKERILYDNLMHQFMRSPIVAQQLMFPFEYKFQTTQKLEWEHNTTHLQRLGFNWQWQDKTLILSSIPAILEIEHVATCIDKIIECITYKEIDKGELVHELLLSLSIAATQIKGKKLMDEELDAIITQLFQCENHQYSPNGKRILNTIPINDLNNYL